MGGQVYLCKLLFSRRTQADFQHFENCRPAPFSGTWGGNPFKYAPTVTIMKTVKHPHSSPTCTPRTALPRSRPTPAPAGSSRQVPATSGPTLDPEQLLKVLTAFRKGDFTVRMPSNLTGIPGKIADKLNGIIENEVRFTHEFTRVAQVVGKQGKVSHRVNVGNAVGSWAQ